MHTQNRKYIHSFSLFLLVFNIKKILGRICHILHVTRYTKAQLTEINAYGAGYAYLKYLSPITNDYYGDETTDGGSILRYAVAVSL